MKRNFNMSESKRERNRDALFGVLHIKDKPYLHQRTVQHMFGETDSTIFVPTAVIDSWQIASLGLGQKIFGCCILGIVAIGVVACLIQLIQINPRFVFPFLP